MAILPGCAQSVLDPGINEAAIRLLEADPTFNAAFGADLNEDGAVQLDAGLMEGARLDVGAPRCATGQDHRERLVELTFARQDLGDDLDEGLAFEFVAEVQLSSPSNSSVRSTAVAGWMVETACL